MCCPKVVDQTKGYDNGLPTVNITAVLFQIKYFGGAYVTMTKPYTVQCIKVVYLTHPRLHLYPWFADLFNGVAFVISRYT